MCHPDRFRRLLLTTMFKLVPDVPDAFLKVISLVFYLRHILLWINGWINYVRWEQ